MTARYRILRFTSESCAICKAQKKALIVERFKDGHSSMQLVEQVCAGSDEEAEKYPERRAAYDLSDKYSITSFPTLVIEAKLDGGASVELCRVEGGATVKQIEKMFAEAQADLVTEHFAWGA